MRERLRGQLRKENVAPASGESSRKKGKPVANYGVDVGKWNIEVKVPQEVAMRLSMLINENNYEKREEVFKNHRDHLTSLFRSV